MPGLGQAVGVNDLVLVIVLLLYCFNTFVYSLILSTNT